MTISWFGLVFRAPSKNSTSCGKSLSLDRPKAEVLEEFVARTLPFTGSVAISIDHMAALHDLQFLPLRIKALPEGSKVNSGVPVFTVRSTRGPKFSWLANNVETSLSNESWKVTTIATIAHAYRKLLTHYAEVTGSPIEFVDWQAHCFANRGMSGAMDAAKNLAGHSLSFLGSDSVSTVDWLEYAYGAKGLFISGSVTATEHSVTTLNIAVIEKQLIAAGETGDLKAKAEEIFIKHLITEICPTGVVSHVSDSYDFWKTITVIAPNLKDVILARKPNAIGLAKVVFRPDSGDPVDVICGAEYQDYSECKTLEEAASWEKERLVDKAGADAGHGEQGDYNVTSVIRYKDKHYSIAVSIDWNRHDKQYYYIDGSSLVGEPKEVTLTPEQKGAVECLWDTFGGTLTSKGFKVLNERVGLIYGDSITLARADAIMKRLIAKGFASCNVVLGVGSYTYNYMTRDSFGFALKATHAIVNGEAVEIYKDPITDKEKTKKSAKGLLRVEKEGNDFVLYDQQTEEQEQQGELRLVYEEGGFHNFEDFGVMRQRLAAST